MVANCVLLKNAFNGVPIDVVSFYKYLGVYFSPKRIWTKTQEMQAMQATKAVARIFKYRRFSNV